MGNKNHLKSINDQNFAHFMRVTTKAFTVIPFMLLSTFLLPCSCNLNVANLFSNSQTFQSLLESSFEIFINQECLLWYSFIFDDWLNSSIIFLLLCSIFDNLRFIFNIFLLLINLCWLLLFTLRWIDSDYVVISRVTIMLILSYFKISLKRKFFVSKLPLSIPLERALLKSGFLSGICSSFESSLGCKYKIDSYLSSIFLLFVFRRLKSGS